MNYTPINIEEKFNKFTKTYAPHVIAELNDYQIKLVRMHGEFVWHDHVDTDEVFIVIEGLVDIEFRDGKVTLHPGEMFVVPKGVEHRPVAVDECKIMLIEPRGVVNTGKAGGEMTAVENLTI